MGGLARALDGSTMIEPRDWGEDEVRSREVARVLLDDLERASLVAGYRGEGLRENLTVHGGCLAASSTHLTPPSRPQRRILPPFPSALQVSWSSRRGRVGGGGGGGGGGGSAAFIAVAFAAASASADFTSPSEIGPNRSAHGSDFSFGAGASIAIGVNVALLPCFKILASCWGGSNPGRGLKPNAGDEKARELIWVVWELRVLLLLA